MKSSMIVLSVVTILLAADLAAGDVFVAGGNRLVSTQNRDGGWDWPLSDESDKFSNAPNILGPTAMGLVHAYRRTADPNQLAALTRASDYLLQKRPQQISPEDGILAVALDDVLGVTKHTEFVKKHFHDALAAGTYDFFGNGCILMDTDLYIFWYMANHIDEGLPNLVAVDMGMALYAAKLVGADTSQWIIATKQGIDLLRDNEPFDVLGLAAALLGLTSVGEEFDPTRGRHASARSLADLAGALARYQLSTGGFTWNGLSLDEEVGNETIQETAYALLALGQFDAQAYASQIGKGVSYLQGAQLPSGGWENFLEDGENNEVTGEALWVLGQFLKTDGQKP